MFLFALSFHILEIQVFRFERRGEEGEAEVGLKFLTFRFLTTRHDSAKVGKIVTVGNRRSPRNRLFRKRTMRHFIRSLVVIAALGTLTSTLSAYPHELAYFNELAGGPRNGYAHLLHSNLDWGQDLLLAAEWQRQHPSKTPVFYLLQCSYDPRIVGIRGADLRTPYLCETLMEGAKGDGGTILLSRQAMLEEANCLSRLDTQVIGSIGMSIVVIRVRAHQSQG
jgi:hypothetical protein